MSHFKPFFYVDRNPLNNKQWTRIFVEPSAGKNGVHIEMLSSDDNSISVNMSFEKFQDFVECCVNAELHLSGELDDWVGEPI